MRELQIKLQDIKDEDIGLYASASWVGSNDVLVCSGNEILEMYNQDSGQKTNSFVVALKWWLDGMESGNSYEILKIDNNEICKLYMNNGVD